MQSESKKEAVVIGAAIVLGLILGLTLNLLKYQELAVYLEPLGEIFIRLLKMVIVPLVFSSIFMSMVNLGTPESLGSMGKKAVLYYFSTTALAVLIGMILVNIIRPGVGTTVEQRQGIVLEQDQQELVTKNQKRTVGEVIIEQLVDTVPENVVFSFGGEKKPIMLQVIFFAILLGIATLFRPKEAEAIVPIMRSLEHLMLTITHWVMKIAPIGIFALVAGIFSKTGLDGLVKMGSYVSTVLIGLFCHSLILLAVGCARLKRSPLFLLRGVGPALMNAFSTSSSAATLPITMANVEENLGVRKDTAKFVLPLGATINMDGTALYESVAAIFIANYFGIELGLNMQIVVFMTATLTAIGAAAIPGAGMVSLTIVLASAGLPAEGIALIAAVDRILDMFRTTVNVFGDAVGSIVVDSYLQDNITQKEFH